MSTPRLSPADMEILAFERTPWKFPAAKDTAVLERFGYRLTTYYAHLNRIIDLPAAEVYDPPLVRRLRQQREQRAAAVGRRATTRSAS